MSEPWITATDPLTGQQWSYQDRSACPTIERMTEGDGPVSWSYEHVNGADTLPGRHARLEAWDDLGKLWQGRLVHRNPPDSSLCSGPCQLRGEGDAGRMRDQRWATSNVYGPVWDGTSNGLRPEAAVLHAMTRVPLVDTMPPTASGFLLTDTEDFQGRTAHDIVNSMTAVSAGLATPYVWSVRSGIFRYQTLDLAPRYQVNCADGAVVAARDDASRLYSRVIVIYGQRQAVTYPDTVTYTRIPTLVDLVVNAGTEINSAGAALQLAQGLYGKLDYLELGWTATITIPFSTEIQSLFPGAGGAVRPWRVNAGYFVRIPDFDPAGKWGTKHPCPDTFLITHARWDGTSNQLVLTGGETRDPSDFVRQVMHAGSSRVVHALKTPGLSIATRDADKTPLLGPAKLADAALIDTNGQRTPQKIDNWIPALSTEHKQTLATNTFPAPFKVLAIIGSADGNVLALGSGDVAADGLLKTTIYSYDVPPGEIDRVVLTGDPIGSITVKVYTAAKNPSSDGRGTYVELNDSFVRDDLLLTASLSNKGIYQHKYTGGAGDVKPRIEEETQLLLEISGIASIKTFTIRLTGNRIVPGHPSGYNTAPALGSRSQ